MQLNRRKQTIGVARSWRTLYFVIRKYCRGCNLRSSSSYLSENGNLRAHYTKTTIRAGEILRLVAVFQDTRRCSSISFGISGGCPEKDQYAQCIDLNGREVFASLSTRGEFYAICQGSVDTGSDAVLYKVHHLAKRQLPLRVSRIYALINAEE